MKNVMLSLLVVAGVFSTVGFVEAGCGCRHKHRKHHCHDRHHHHHDHSRGSAA